MLLAELRKNFECISLTVKLNLKETLVRSEDIIFQGTMTLAAVISKTRNFVYKIQLTKWSNMHVGRQATRIQRGFCLVGFF